MLDTPNIARLRARYEALIETTNTLLTLADDAEKAWKEAEKSRQEAFKDLVRALEDVQSDKAQEVADICGAQEWHYDEVVSYAGEKQEVVVVRATCELLKDHPSRYHQEMREGKLWAAWSDGTNERAPKN